MFDLISCSVLSYCVGECMRSYLYAGRHPPSPNCRHHSCPLSHEGKPRVAAIFNHAPSIVGQRLA
jgi:hypothetical protein